MTRLLMIIAGVSLGGCEAEPEQVLTPNIFPAKLEVAPSTAAPNRLCHLVGADGRAFDLKIHGGVAYQKNDLQGNWQIVQPAAWSAKAVSSEFDMGLGGVSTHRWKSEGGDMSARVEWCDECPRDGSDSTIVVYDHSFSVFAGVCRSIGLQNEETETPS